MRFVLRVLALALALAALTFAPAARAQSAEAQKHITAGEKAGSANDWNTALAEFEEAHKLSPGAPTQRRVANALYQLQRWVDAQDAYELLLKDYGSALSKPDKKQAEDRRTELRGKVGKIDVRASETGAEVTIDGAVVGLTPMATPVRIAAGGHKVFVRKLGFTDYEASVEVTGNAVAVVNANLAQLANTGELEVTVEGGASLTVLIDGQEVGPAPYRGSLAPGSYKVAGRSPTARAPEVTVEVKTGQQASVKLVPGAAGGTLEVRVDPVKSEVFVDGKKVSDGNFKGELDAGEHELKVTAKGYAPEVAKVTIVSGEIHVETVVLHKAAAGTVREKEKRAWSFNGLYGGLQFIGMFEPTGSGNSLDDGCDVLGATSCEGGTPLGGGLSGYIGYAFAPVGLEFYVLGGADVVEPSANFDGTTSSEVNPLVAQPARDESFVIGRFGGGGAFRLRLLYPIARFRITGAIGAGLAYRHLLLGRETVAANGATSDVAPDGDGYLSAVLSVELGGQVLLGGTTSLALGFNMWLEHAGDGVATASDSKVLLVKEGEIPAPQATPAYDMASATQLFLGPYLGLHFGP